MNAPLAYLDTVNSPAGPLAFAVDEAGALLALSFRDGAYPETMEGELARRGYHATADADRTAPARRELAEYAAGHRRRFTLPLALAGTPWQLAVWEALTRIPYGETRSYGQVAAMLGRPGAARAVGRANATNRLPLVVPCHRVVAANGSLHGFAGGTAIKARLLAHETRTLAATAGNCDPAGPADPADSRSGLPARESPDAPIAAPIGPPNDEIPAAPTPR